MSSVLWSAAGTRIAFAAFFTVLGGCHHDWEMYSPGEGATAGGSGSHGGSAASSSSSMASSNPAAGGSAMSSAAMGGGGSGVGGDAGPDAPRLPYDQEVLADGPVVYLRFGESAGPTAHDEMGNYDGTYPTSAVTYGAPGALAGDANTGIMLNHQTPLDDVQGIAMPPGLDFAGTVPFTIELWASQTSFDGYGFTVDHEDWTQQRAGWLVTFQDIGVSLERWDNDTTSGSVAQSPAPLPFDGYHHVVGVSEPTQIRLYIDGALQSANGAVTVLKSTGTAWTIGKQNCNCSTNAFAGSLDEFAVYDKALSEERILVHYQVGSGK